MLRSAHVLAALALLAGASAVALSAGCAGGAGNGPNAVISPPPFETTPTPQPTVGVIPGTLTFAKGSTSSVNVVLAPPNIDDFSFSVTADTCTPHQIASAVSSPVPSGNPSEPSTEQSNTYIVTPGKENGTCSFTFVDGVSHASGTLGVTNHSGTTAARHPR